jgi:hypothetical protein
MNVHQDKPGTKVKLFDWQLPRFFPLPIGFLSIIAWLSDLVVFPEFRRYQTHPNPLQQQVPSSSQYSAGPYFGA